MDEIFHDWAKGYEGCDYVDDCDEVAKHDQFLHWPVKTRTMTSVTSKLQPTRLNVLRPFFERTPKGLGCEFVVFRPVANRSNHCKNENKRL